MILDVILAWLGLLCLGAPSTKISLLLKISDVGVEDTEVELIVCVPSIPIDIIVLLLLVVVILLILLLLPVLFVFVIIFDEEFDEEFDVVVIVGIPIFWLLLREFVPIVDIVDDEGICNNEIVDNEADGDIIGVFDRLLFIVVLILLILLIDDGIKDNFDCVCEVDDEFDNDCEDCIFESFESVVFER